MKQFMDVVRENRALRRKVEEEELTVVFITHDTELADRWADKIYCLEDQKLKEKGAGR